MNQYEITKAFKNAGCPFDALIRVGNGKITRNNLLSLVEGQKAIPEHKLNAISEALKAVTA